MEAEDTEYYQGELPQDRWVCPSCHQGYNLDNRQPIHLRCGHSICGDCADTTEQIGSRQIVDSCPVCHTQYPGGFRRNNNNGDNSSVRRALNNHVNFARREEGPVCDEHREPQAFVCSTDRKRLCSKCVNEHTEKRCVVYNVEDLRRKIEQRKKATKQSIQMWKKLQSDRIENSKLLDDRIRHVLRESNTIIKRRLDRVEESENALASLVFRKIMKSNPSQQLHAEATGNRQALNTLIQWDPLQQPQAFQDMWQMQHNIPPVNTQLLLQRPFESAEIAKFKTHAYQLPENLLYRAKTNLFPGFTTDQKQVFWEAVTRCQSTVEFEMKGPELFIRPLTEGRQPLPNFEMPQVLPTEVCLDFREDRISRDSLAAMGFFLQKFPVSILAIRANNPAITAEEISLLFSNPKWAGGQIVSLAVYLSNVPLTNRELTLLFREVLPLFPHVTQLILDLSGCDAVDQLSMHQLVEAIRRMRIWKLAFVFNGCRLFGDEALDALSILGPKFFQRIDSFNFQVGQTAIKAQGLVELGKTVFAHLSRTKHVVLNFSDLNFERKAIFSQTLTRLPSGTLERFLLRCDGVSNIQTDDALMFLGTLRKWGVLNAFAFSCANADLPIDLVRHLLTALRDMNWLHEISLLTSANLFKRKEASLFFDGFRGGSSTYKPFENLKTFQLRIPGQGVDWTPRDIDLACIALQKCKNLTGLRFEIRGDLLDEEALLPLLIFANVNEALTRCSLLILQPWFDPVFQADVRRLDTVKPFLRNSQP